MRSKLALALVLVAVVAFFLSACGSDFSEAEEHTQKGADFHQQGRWAEAVAEFTEAIRLNPEIAVAYSNRGNTYLQLGQLERAIQDIDEAIRLDPQPLAYNNRAVSTSGWGSTSRRSRPTTKLSA